MDESWNYEYTNASGCKCFCALGWRCKDRKNVKYNGSSNDKDVLLNAVGTNLPNNILFPVYRKEDVNLDAKVKYNNTDNDKNFILNQVFMANPILSIPNFIIGQHTPD